MESTSPISPPLCHLESTLPTPYPLENTDIFNVSIDLPFPQYHLLGIIHKLLKLAFFTSIQFSSVAQSCLTFCDPMNCSTPGLPVHHQLPEITQTHDHQVGDAIQPSHPLSSPFSSCPQSLPASVFSNESTLHMRWPKYWSLSFSIIPSQEHPGLISL